MAQGGRPSSVTSALRKLTATAAAPVPPSTCAASGARSRFQSAVESNYLSVVQAYHLAVAKVQRGDAALRSPAQMLAPTLSEEAMQALDAVWQMVAASEGREGDGAHAPWAGSRGATLRWSHSSQASQTSQQ